MITGFIVSGLLGPVAPVASAFGTVTKLVTAEEDESLLPVFASGVVECLVSEPLTGFLLSSAVADMLSKPATFNGYFFSGISDRECSFCEQERAKFATYDGFGICGHCLDRGAQAFCSQVDQTRCAQCRSRTALGARFRGAALCPDCLASRFAAHGVKGVLSPDASSDVNSFLGIPERPRSVRQRGQEFIRTRVVGSCIQCGSYDVVVLSFKMIAPRKKGILYHLGTFVERGDEEAEGERQERRRKIYDEGEFAAYYFCSSCGRLLKFSQPLSTIEDDWFEDFSRAIND